MMDYDIPVGSVDRRRRADAGHREPDRLAAASGGLGRGARDGAAGRRAAGDGRALRPRRPRHPGDRHPCLPALSHCRPSCRTRGGRSASGWPAASSAALLLVVLCVRVVRRSTTRPAPVHDRSSGPRWSCSGCCSTPPGTPSRAAACRGRGRAAGGGQRLPPPRVRVGRGAGGPPAAGCAVGGARPGRRRPASRRWASRAPTAPGRSGRSASCGCWSTSGRDANRSRRRPGRRVPGCGAGRSARPRPAPRPPSGGERVAVTFQAASHPDVVRRLDPHQHRGDVGRAQRAGADALDDQQRGRLDRHALGARAGVPVPARQRARLGRSASGRSRASSWASTVGSPSQPSNRSSMCTTTGAGTVAAIAAARVVLPDPAGSVDAHQPTVPERRRSDGEQVHDPTTAAELVGVLAARGQDRDAGCRRNLPGSCRRCVDGPVGGGCRRRGSATSPEKGNSTCSPPLCVWSPPPPSWPCPHR